MELTTEIRNKELIQKVLDDILASDVGKLRFMEVCGTHTVAISQSGLRSAFSEKIEFVSGPGCPVCVTSVGEIDAVIEIAKIENTVIFTFGDIIRVPGSTESLEYAGSTGADIKIMYSPDQALTFARENKNKRVVMVGVGFETTSPVFAASLVQAKKENIDNIFIISLFKIIPPAIHMILLNKDTKIDGFILPGHVSSIIGTKPYQFIPDEFNMGGVICGFETLDVLQGVKILINQNQPAIVNEYKRVVKDEGNTIAIKLLSEVFKIADSSWRGIGVIHRSGFILSEKFRQFDALKEFKVEIKNKPEPKGCLCGEVLKGKIIPTQCSLFGKRCLPESPVGPCMVSSEGVCGAYYKYDTGCR